MPRARSAGTRSRSAPSALILAIAGTFGAWLGGKLDDRDRAEDGDRRERLVLLLFALAVILMIDRDQILFVRKSRRRCRADRLFGAAAERAYLLIGVVARLCRRDRLQAASRSLLIRLAPPDRITQYFGLFALTRKGDVVRRVRCWSPRSPRDDESEGRHGGADRLLRDRPGIAAAGQVRVAA